MDTYLGNILSCPICQNRHFKIRSSESMKIIHETVPYTWTQALYCFFIGYIGHLLVLLSISSFISTCLRLSMPFLMTEAAIITSTILFRWIQETFFHIVLLHSHNDWMGKSMIIITQKIISMFRLILPYSSLGGCPWLIYC